MGGPVSSVQPRRSPSHLVPRPRQACGVWACICVGARAWAVGGLTALAASGGEGWGEGKIKLEVNPRERGYGSGWQGNPLPNTKPSTPPPLPQSPEEERSVLLPTDRPWGLQEGVAGRVGRLQGPGGGGGGRGKGAEARPEVGGGEQLRGTPPHLPQRMLHWPPSFWDPERLPPPAPSPAPP